jgi:hypothetical protein
VDANATHSSTSWSENHGQKNSHRQAIPVSGGSVS